MISDLDNTVSGRYKSFTQGMKIRFCLGNPGLKSVKDAGFFNLCSNS